jgi:hypothetical protein
MAWIHQMNIASHWVKWHYDQEYNGYFNDEQLADRYKMPVKVMGVVIFEQEGHPLCIVKTNSLYTTYGTFWAHVNEFEWIGP